MSGLIIEGPEHYIKKEQRLWTEAVDRGCGQRLFKCAPCEIYMKLPYKVDYCYGISIYYLCISLKKAKCLKKQTPSSSEL